MLDAFYATPPSRCYHLPITLFRAERLLPHSHGTSNATLLVAPDPATGPSQEMSNLLLSVSHPRDYLVDDWLFSWGGHASTRAQMVL
jgi:hypothetical protein